MKINTFILALALGFLTISAEHALAQEEREMTRAEFEKIDSAELADERKQVIQAQAEKDATRMSDAKDAEKETKAVARETRRVDREARSAAKEAKLFLRAEKKAQKARKDAERQSGKADKAKVKSDKN